MFLQEFLLYFLLAICSFQYSEVCITMPAVKFAIPLLMCYIFRHQDKDTSLAHTITMTSKREARFVGCLVYCTSIQSACLRSNLQLLH